MQQRLVVAGILGALDAIVDGARDKVFDPIGLQVVQILGRAHITVARVGRFAQHLIV